MPVRCERKHWKVAKTPSAEFFPLQPTFNSHQNISLFMTNYCVFSFSLLETEKSREKRLFLFYAFQHNLFLLSERLQRRRGEMFRCLFRGKVRRKCDGTFLWNDLKLLSKYLWRQWFIMQFRVEYLKNIGLDWRSHKICWFIWKV